MLLVARSPDVEGCLAGRCPSLLCPATFPDRGTVSVLHCFLSCCAGHLCTVSFLAVRAISRLNSLCSIFRCRGFFAAGTQRQLFSHQLFAFHWPGDDSCRVSLVWEANVLERD